MAPRRRDLERKRALERTRVALAQAITEGIEAARRGEQRSEPFKDPYGAAATVHDEEIAAAVVDRRARELAEVSHALERMDAGGYGVCRDCGAPIPEARLRVLPFATRCVACQARAERLRGAA